MRNWMLASVLVLAACGKQTAIEGPAGPTGTDDGGLRGSGGLDGSAAAPGTDGAAGSTGGLPCDVEDVIARRCRGCHASPPRYGAPMPLGSHADLHAPAVTAPTRQVHELVKQRIHDTERPMPPTGDLTGPELAALDAWLNASAPLDPSSCGDGPADDPSSDGGTPHDAGPAEGPGALSCTPTHTFTTHAAGSSEPYHVPTDAGNLYQCFTFRSPWNGTTQATAWAPILDDERVVHHWILYSSQTPQADGGVGRCNMPLDAQFVAGWAPGGGNNVLPADVGLELPGPSTYLILQVHYYNAAGYTDALDKSGVAFCTTETPRAKKAGVLTLGAVGIRIPPRSSEVAVTGTCQSYHTRLLREPIYAIGSAPHMHKLGKKFRTEIIRDGTGATEMLIDVPRFDFESQSIYPHTPPIQINPGDTLRTTCWFDNPGDQTVSFGERTEDEMCFNFALVYPIDALPARVCGIF